MQLKYIAVLLFFTVLLTQCKNRFTDSDGVPPNAESKEVNVQVLKQGFTLLDLKKNFAPTRSVIFEITNAAQLTGELSITTDGYLVYRAAQNELTESVNIKVKDKNSNASWVSKVNVSVVQQLPPGRGACFFNIKRTSVIVGNQPVTRAISEFVQTDTACGYRPTGDFEVIFPPRDMPFSYANGELRFSPNPRGATLQELFYKGKYVGTDSSYVGLLFVFNETGCDPTGVNDAFVRNYAADSIFYTFNVLANDIFCTLSPSAVSIVYSNPNDTNNILFPKARFGRVEIVNNQLRYYPHPASRPPIRDVFSVDFVIPKRKNNFFIELDIL